MLERIKIFLQEVHRWIIHEEEFLKVEEHLLTDAIKDNRDKIRGYHFKQWFVPHHINNHNPWITHHRTLSFFILCMFSFKIIALSFFIPVGNTYAGGISSEGLVELTNQARAEHHLSTLKVNQDLVIAARMKAMDMFEYSYWAHTSPTGVEPWHWFDEVDYYYEHAGENLAMDFYSTEGVFEGWENSALHWENIMKPEFKEIGIAVVPGIFEGKNTTIVVQLFGTRIERYGAPEIENKNQDAKKQEPKNIQNIAEAKSLVKPIINNPKHNSHINDSKPMIIGQADPQVLVYIMDDKTNIGKVPTDDYGYYSYRTPQMFDGQYNIKSLAIDEDIQSEYSDTVTVYLDTISPLIVADSLDVSQERSEGYIEFDISINVMDDPEKVSLIYQDRTLNMINVKNDTWNYKFSVMDTGEPSYNFTIYAEDKAGNSAVSDFQIEVLDNEEKVLGIAIEAEINSEKNLESNIQNLKDENLEDMTSIVKAEVNNEKQAEENNQRVDISSENLSKQVVILSEVDGSINDIQMESEEIEIKKEEILVEEKQAVITYDEIESLDHEVLPPKVEKEMSADISRWINYIKYFTLAIGSFFFLSYLFQAYVVYHKGLKDEHTHPIFHAVGVLCIMLLIIII